MSRLAHGLGLVLVILASATPAAARHGVAEFDARRITPGIQITLVERPGAAAPTSGTPVYRLTAAGVPRGVLFGVWTRDFGGPFQQVARGFRVSEAGVLESIDEGGRPRRLEELVFDPGPYPRGAAWEVALVSADHAVVAVARVVPRPIVARNGACAVSLELASRRGDRFIVATQGFEPGESVLVQMQQATGTTTKQLYVPPPGRLPLDVVEHGAAGPDHRARYTVTGETCAVAVDYIWGEPVLTQDLRTSVR